MTTEDLAKRVMILEDIEAIKQLKGRYCRTMDTKDWAGMRRVFADDVVMDTTASGGSVITGADAFIAFLEQTLGDAITVHHGHMPEIEITGTRTARGIWAMADYVEWPSAAGAFWPARLRTTRSRT